MTLQEAHIFLKDLLERTTNKSEIKVYQKFIHLLSGLKEREFSKDQIRSIEAKLEDLHLKSDTKKRKKYIRSALNKFEKYLRQSFSFTIKGYYTSRGIALGSSFGIIFGIVFLSSFERSMGIALGISIGMLIGLIIGRLLDAKAEASGNIL